jgi:magnesium-transporting ATPase (P-type)
VRASANDLFCGFLPIQNALFSGDILDAVTIFATILIIISVEIHTEWKAKRSVKSLSRNIAYNTAVLRDNTERVVASEGLVVGDVLFLSRGQMVPCDARVLMGLDLSTDESALTGESEPVRKTDDADIEGSEGAITLVAISHGIPISHTDISSSRCMVYAGTLISSGRGVCVRTRTR